MYQLFTKSLVSVKRKIVLLKKNKNTLNAHVKALQNQVCKKNEKETAFLLKGFNEKSSFFVEMSS